MDLRARLDGYQVTSLPAGADLRLVWSLADDDDVVIDLDGDDVESAGGAPLAILTDYRITRIPGRAAS